MLIRISGGGPGCSEGNCPTVYIDDAAPATLVIQGDRLTPTAAAELGELPARETVLRVPQELIIDAYEKLRTAGALSGQSQGGDSV